MGGRARRSEDRAGYPLMAISDTYIALRVWLPRLIRELNCCQIVRGRRL